MGNVDGERILQAILMGLEQMERDLMESLKESNKEFQRE
jgi:hypothetical protein